ncbi:TnsA-like heteromeric transposase endonuclease subunit [Streptomyces sp. NPDC058001]|uniref:TnsA-like heteromeric transposase endonuclease subunit n=1 Tax=Streptomyces sp. NPDC058001 TaxID=3346300 RepID=UPI0036EE4DF9
MPYVAVSCVDGRRERRRRPLLDCVAVRLEDAVPVRPFRWPTGGRHFPGWYWAATTGQHVGFESWLERDHLVLMDFDPAVVGVASQPFWLHWHDGSRERRHAPDFFVRRADGSAVVVDVRAHDWIAPRDAEAFEVTRRACAGAGWDFERVGTPEAVLLANVRWLSRYRHPRCRQGPVAAPADGRLLATGAADARGRCGRRPARDAAGAVPPAIAGHEDRHVQMNSELPPRFAPLPVRLRPCLGESANSYIRRLARANHLKPSFLHCYLCGPPQWFGKPLLEHLATAAGRSPEVLERALADADALGGTNRPCRRLPR